MYEDLIILDTTSHRCISFPWVAWDVLNDIRKQSIAARHADNVKFSFSPLSDTLSEHIYEYVEDPQRKRKWKHFKANLYNATELRSKDEEVAYGILSDYCGRHKGNLICRSPSLLPTYLCIVGLDLLMFFCVRWGMKGRIFEGTDNA